MFDINQFLKGLDGPARKRAIDAAVRSVDRFAHDLIRRAKELTPIKTGALMDSGINEPAQYDGRDITALVGFNTHYAAAVHERLDVYHPVGQAKYLETPMRQREKELAPYVEREMRKAL